MATKMTTAKFMKKADTKQILCGVRTITPKEARIILDGSTSKNRRIGRRHVKKLVHAIKKGQWRLNGETLVFDKNMNVIDGQHRLSACIYAKKSIITLVVVNIPLEVWLTHGEGKRRNHADALGAEGHQYTSTLAATLKLYVQYIKDPEWPRNSSIINNQDIMEMADTYPDIERSIRIGTKCHIVLPKAQAACMHYIFAQGDMESADEFFEFLAHGGADIDNPVHVLREKLLRNRTDGKKSTRWDDKTSRAIVIKAWNAYQSGKKVKVLAWTPKSKFPRVKR